MYEHLINPIFAGIIGAVVAVLGRALIDIIKDVSGLKERVKDLERRLGARQGKR